jgi:predicted acyl esterase
MGRVERDVRIPVRDGREIAADLYLPGKSGPSPAILVQTPYGKERLGAALPHPSARSWLDFWDRERYALVISDWWGFGADVVKPPPSHSGRDGYDLVEWTAAQGWCDGRVVGWGPSAMGRAALRTAIEKPPHLVCGVPLVCAMGHHYEDAYQGGVLRESHFRTVTALGFEMEERVRAAPLSGDPFWRDGMAEHRPDLLDLPLLVITGWYDIVVARTLSMHAELGRHATLLVGPWHHTAVDERRQGGLAYPGAVGAAAEATRLFLDRWLLGEDPGGFSDRPRVRWWQMGEERWLDADAWPPPGTSPRVLHLTADGSLVDRRPGPGTRSFVDDPENPVPTIGGANLPVGLAAGPRDQRKVEARDDVLVYSTPPLTEPVALCGDARVVLTAASDALDQDLAVRLTDVEPDGRSMLVGDSIARAKLRASTAKPVPIVPGQLYEVEVCLPPTALTFLPGHRIRISVSGTNWPRFERNAHTGADHYDQAEAVPATTTLHHGGDARSFLELNVR